jgi:hypothetical protein
MDPPQRSKPNSAPPNPQAARPVPSPPRTDASAGKPQAPRAADPHDPIPSGRVRHDERGNAIWDWLKDTGRNALEATSRLLKKLEAPHLDVEDTKDQELRLESDRDPGGGYDPYNQSSKSRKPPTGKGR